MSGITLECGDEQENADTDSFCHHRGWKGASLYGHCRNEMKLSQLDQQSHASSSSHRSAMALQEAEVSSLNH